MVNIFRLNHFYLLGLPSAFASRFSKNFNAKWYRKIRYKSLRFELTLYVPRAYRLKGDRTLRLKPRMWFKTGVTISGDNRFYWYKLISLFVPFLSTSTFCPDHVTTGYDDYCTVQILLYYVVPWFWLGESRSFRMFDLGTKFVCLLCRINSNNSL